MLMALAMPASAQPSGRHLQVAYTGPAMVGRGTHFAGTCATDCMTFTAAPGERVIRISLVDATGHAVGWAAETNKSVVASGCGTGVLKTALGQHWWISAVVTPQCSAPPTQGTLGVTLSGD
jgi:hypothetical protein